ncbi:GTP binding protein [[Synechococcus] sp. NIES-970]|nr:GTP binding protein [[Synechococcus] sp. NIES-970]
MADWSKADLEGAIANFSDIQTEINYQHAQEIVRHVLQHLDLTQTEQQGLEEEIDQLSQMLDKLERTRLQIAVFGLVGRGKSSILNALLGEEIFQTGAIHGVTTDIHQVPWTLQTEAIANSEIQRATFFQQGQGCLELIDTPGIDEVNGETREQLAKLVAKQMDLLLFVVAGDMSRVEFDALSQLRDVGKPMILVFNKVDQYPQADRELIYQTICDRRVKELLSPDEIVMVSAAPLVTKIITDAAGQRQLIRERGPANIGGLKLKILEILDREGKALLALNSMLFVDQLQNQLAQRKLLLRAEAATRLIEQAMVTKAVAVALNPVTVVDVFSGAVVDVALIIRLAQWYGLPLKHQEAIALLQKIVLSMGGVSLGELLAHLGLSSLKTLLGVSLPLAGGLSAVPYLSVAVTQGAIAGLTTQIIGKSTQAYLANGGSWGDSDPKVVVKNIIDSLDQDSILHRLRQELTAKLQPQ